MTPSHVNIAEPAIVRSDRYRLKQHAMGYSVVVDPGTPWESEIFASDGGLMTLAECESVMDFLDQRTQ